jgi:uncharacterized protein (TIGR02246 family)
VDTAAEEAMLTAATDPWFAAFNAGDAEAVTAHYADDAVVMPPHAPVAKGREAIKALMTTDVAATKAAGLVLINGASAAGVSGNLGWHQGTYTVKNAAGEIVDSGSYMEAWKKGADGKWLIIRDIWNSDRPATPPSPAPAS